MMPEELTGSSTSAQITYIKGERKVWLLPYNKRERIRGEGKWEEEEWEREQRKEEE